MQNIDGYRKIKKRQIWKLKTAMMGGGQTSHLAKKHICLNDVTKYNALALVVAAMRSLIVLPAAPPLLLKTLIKFRVYLSSSAKNLA